VNPRATALLATVVGGAYAVAMVVRGDLLPGLVGGLLAGILVVLLGRRVDAHNRMRRRAAEQRHRGSREG
jgi:fructose-specific phosphotransferase system IIC component